MNPLYKPSEHLHRLSPPRWAWRLLMELAFVLLLLVALFLTAEAICGTLDMPRAITDLR